MDWRGQVLQAESEHLSFQQEYEVSLIPSHDYVLNFANKAEGSSTHLSNVHDFDGCQLTRFDMATLSKREKTVSTSILPIPSAYTHLDRNSSHWVFPRYAGPFWYLLGNITNTLDG